MVLHEPSQHNRIGAVGTNACEVDQVLHIADLWPIDGRVADLVEEALGDRTSDAAEGRVRGPDAVLVAARPAVVDPRAAPRRAIREQGGHDDSSLNRRGWKHCGEAVRLLAGACGRWAAFMPSV